MPSAPVTRAVSAATAVHGAALMVPLRENAVPWATDHPRTQALADIATHDLSAWKRARSYPHRSLAEKSWYRFKPLFSDRQVARRFETHLTEVHVRVAALNVMAYLGMPISVPVGVSQS